MYRIIQNLSNKITRLEVEGQTPGRFQPTTPKNPNTFRRPFNPQILPRDRRPEEQPMQSPVWRNLGKKLEDAYEEDTQELNQEEMHWLNDNDEGIHLTRDEYSQSINNLDYYEYPNWCGFTPIQFQWMADNITDGIQHKYDLRPRTGNPKTGENSQ